MTMRTLAAAFGVVFLLAGDAAAQQAQSVREAVARLKPGQTIFVIDAAGRELRGAFVEMAASELVVRVDDGRQAIDERDVRRIDKRGDPVWDGALKGAAVGLALGLLSKSDDCSAPECSILGLALFHAEIGTLVDLLHRGRTTIFAAPASSLKPSSSLAVMLAVGRREGRVLLSVRY